jgi:translation initiation factor IF-2
MKMTVASVVKKLVTLGIMAGAPDIIDYDTAAPRRDDLGAKVEKEVVVTSRNASSAIPTTTKRT